MAERASRPLRNPCLRSAFPVPPIDGVGSYLLSERVGMSERR